jgi:group I intron endonuclease
MYVYVITNWKNEKVYVGQHAGDDLVPYLNKNITDALRGDRRKTALYNAFRKYGRNMFFISPLVLCKTKDELDSWEKIYIKTFGSNKKSVGYNLTDGGGGVSGYKFSEEQMASRVFKPISEETRRKLSAVHKGKKFSKEHCAKISAANERRGSSTPTMGAIRNRRYRAKKKLKEALNVAC